MDTRVCDRVDEALRDGHNVAILGQGGTGKTERIKRFIEETGSRSIVRVAYTGKATSLIDGAYTINSYFEINPYSKMTFQQYYEKYSKYNLMSKYNARRAGRRVDCPPWMNNLIEKFCKKNKVSIDEISMVDERLMLVMDAVLRGARECNDPFGGMQVILSGDFHQLPPVTVEETRHLFESRIWKRLNLRVFVLTFNHRATDPLYRKVLDEMWMNKLTTESVDRLRRHCERTRDERPDASTVVMHPHNKQTDTVNDGEYEKIFGEERVFASKRSLKTNDVETSEGFTEQDEREFETIEKNVMTVKPSLKLKVGCKVMLRKNVDVHRKLINGAVGTVTAFDAEGNPRVLFAHGEQVNIAPASWSEKKNDREYVVRAVPLILAWSITVHKSQGSKYEKTMFSCDWRVKKAGMAYTAFSRAVGFEGLLLKEFNEENIVMDERVCSYYEKMLKEQGDCRVERETKPQSDIQKATETGSFDGVKRKRSNDAYEDE